jgi:transcriptional regulator with XRE-family HTH domain
MLMIGERLRTIRELKNLSQGDIEKRTGLIRCYTSRVENGHTVPSIETLAKFAQALDIPLYQIFYDGEAEPKKIKGLDLDGAQLSNSERREIESLGRKFTKLKERDKGLVRMLVAKLAQAYLVKRHWDRYRLLPT